MVVEVVEVEAVVVVKVVVVVEVVEEVMVVPRPPGPIRRDGVGRNLPKPEGSPAHLLLTHPLPGGDKHLGAGVLGVLGVLWCRGRCSGCWGVRGGAWGA